MINISSSTHETTFVFSTDRGFAPCLGVLIRSILDHSNSERFYRLVVLHGELDAENIRTLNEMIKDYKNVSLDFMDVTEELTGYSFFTENRVNITREAYFRLLIPWLLPQTEKAVYLDCDMVALTDISALYDTDVSDVLLAASRDFIGIGIYYSGRFGLKNYFDNELCFPNPNDYFISGVLVMNLEAFRKRFSKKQILDYAASQPWHFHDQDVLNIICFGETLFLSAKWGAVGNSEYENFLTPKLRVEAMNAHQDPYIFHFAGPRNKPWHRITEYSLAWFWPTAARTPYYGVLMEKFVEWQQPSQVKIRGEKNMLKRFLKKFLPSSARQTNFEFRCLEQQLVEQRMLTLQLMMQIQRLEASKELNGSSEQLSRKQELLAATEGRPECIKHITPRKKLRFEIDIAGHCNMSCAGCAHFSPLCSEEFADIKETEDDFVRLSQLFDGEVEYIHLIGGEPLLHPKIGEFALLARRYFPIGRIEIVTNGLLLPKLKDNFWEACRNSDVIISVTRYPTSFAYDDLPALAALHGVKFQFFNKSGEETVSFNKLKISPLGGHNPDHSFINCYLANECIFLQHGRLYPCSIISHIRYFNEYFNQDIPVKDEDSIDIYAAKSKKEILDFLAQPVPFCTHCDIAGRKHSLPWRPSGRDISEWI